MLPYYKSATFIGYVCSVIFLLKLIICHTLKRVIIHKTMLKSNVYRVLYKENYKNVLLRLCSTKKDGNKGDAPKTIDNKQGETQTAEDITSKINKLLLDMMENNTKVNMESVKKFSLQNDDIGTQRSRKGSGKKSEKNLTHEQKIKQAAAEVAESIGEDKAQVEKDLVDKAMTATNMTPTNLDWGELISGMGVDNSKTGEYHTTTRSQQVHQAMNKHGDFRQRQPSIGESLLGISSRPKVQTVDIFGGKPLDIFQTTTGETGTKLETWDRLCDYELKLAASHPPNNYFEKMIQWTEQGKIWKFPIDNEQGLEEEQSIHFSEHIFLDVHLEGWCPSKGPVRHFMELVCVGLSKNPYLPAKNKRDHIAWFKDYFESKKELLMEVGALGQDTATKPLSVS